MADNVAALDGDVTIEHSLALREAGWTLLPSIVPAERVARLVQALDEVYAQQRPIQIRNGVGEGTDGTVHHLPCAGDVFLDFLAEGHGQVLLDRHFEGPYILNTFGGLLNLPTDASYVGRVHRDQRTFSGQVRLMAQLLVMLDEFTEENGATFLLDGSHRLAEKPSDDLFFGSAARAIGPPGIRPPTI